jgi:hypothetical protein
LSEEAIHGAGDLGVARHRALPRQMDFGITPMARAVTAFKNEREFREGDDNRWRRA